MTKHTYKITVDYSKSVEDLVKQGEYDWTNDYITSTNFHSKEKGKGKVKITLFNFGKSISSKEAIKKMMDKGYRSATLKELLALGSQKPDLQRKNYIVALGSKWRDSDGRVCVPYLRGDGGSRRLCLGWWSGGWGSGWRFAAVQVDTLKPLKKLKNLDTLTLSEINTKLDKIIKFFSIK